MSSNEHPLTNLLRQLELYTGLPEEDRRLVMGLPHRVRRLDAGSYVIREGDLPGHCCVLVSGYAFRQKVTGTGARQILALCIPGDAVDLQNMFLDVSDHSVQLLTQCEVADIPREALQELVMQRAAVGTAIIELTLVESSILREWVVNVGRRDARARVAHILCEFAVRLESRGLAPHGGFELPMTQEQLADATGLTSVHINRVLKSLEADGLINRKRRQIHFEDWRALQYAGDFSRRYLHISDHDVVSHSHDSSSAN
ncbi:MAG TPA: Crp/Fnr family transcriptional regulator [Sphingomicrobium sp.]|nr:Crp/Fnr family transcriptional regulator [Sphingomicrobium sp.]